MSVKVKLYSSYFLIIILAGIMAGIAFMNLGRVNDQSTIISNVNIPRIILTSRLNMLESDHRKLMLAHIISQTPQEMAVYEKGIQELEKQLDEGIKTVIDRNHETAMKEKSEKTGEIWNEYKQNTRAILNLSAANKTQEAMDLVTGESAQMDQEISALLAEFVQYNEDAADKASAEGDEIFENSKLVLLGIVAVITVISLAIAIYMVRYISSFINEFIRVSNMVSKGDLKEKINFAGTDEFGTMTTSFNATIESLRELLKKIQYSAEQVASSSEELTASADQSAQVTTQVAQSISQVSDASEKQLMAVNSASSAIEEISASVEEVSANAATSADQAMQTMNTAKDGGISIDKAIKQMQTIEKTVNESAAVIATLGERSKEIDQIVDTISGIAGQTNLLALNAAIEAARAGEHGKGFAVVAEEVRKLAEQSQEAAQKISDLISKIQDETQQAVVAMQSGTQEVKTGTVVVNESGEAFRQISELSGLVAKQVDSIASTIQEVATGTQDIVGSIRHIDQETRGVAAETQNVSAAAEEQSASMEQIAASSQSLAKLAQDLQDETRKFAL